jgi:hypothetical protein
LRCGGERQRQPRLDSRVGCNINPSNPSMR